jgi:hypothetical protein
VLVDELEKLKQRELVAKWDENERKLQAELPFRLPAPVLSADTSERYARFSAWAKTRNVRELPARPSTVASFILEQTSLGMAVDNLLAILDAVEQAHLNLSNAPRMSSLPLAWLSFAKRPSTSLPASSNNKSGAVQTALALS